MAELAAGLEESAGLYWVNWCGSDACEDAFVALKASVRAIPFDEAGSNPSGNCINCDKEATTKVLVAKSY